MEENIQLANARLITNLVSAAEKPAPHLVSGTVSLNTQNAKLVMATKTPSMTTPTPTHHQAVVHLQAALPLQADANM